MVMKLETVLALGSLPLVGLSACSARGAEGGREGPALPAALGAQAQVVLADEPEVRAELEAVLFEYFGSPHAPRFRPLEGWAERGFDPNRGPFDGLRPADDLDGTPPEALRADNRQAWAAELAAIASGEVRRVGPWPGRGVMNQAWGRLLGRRTELGPRGFEEHATNFFVERYPDLAEAAQLFRPNCVPCHGHQGGGDGHLSELLVPRPRDYQRGVFKFVTVEGGSKPRRGDLVRTLVQGLPGSAMPSFRGLSLAEIGALVDYVRYLSIRGEMEALLVSSWESAELAPREAAQELYELIWGRWLAAAERGPGVPLPPADRDPARLALGDAVFHDRQRGNCVSCHGETGRGDGVSALQRAEDGKLYALLRDGWGHYLLPRDLTTGVFRGGERRVDIYLRIHCGIPGTPMPGVGGSFDAAGAPLLSEGEKWAVVDYVLSLSGRGPFGDGGSP